jgi:hypothetical protein
MASGARDKVFISYSKEDQRWLDRLLTVVWARLPERPDEIWWDGRIKAGQQWMEEISKALDSAKVAVFLVSQNFLATEFILKVELPRLLAREGVTVLWSLVRNCPWESSQLAPYQAVRYQRYHEMKAWNALSEAELDDLLKDLAKEIEENLRSGPAASNAAPVIPAPVQERRPASPQTDSAHARELLKDVKDPRIMDEIGSLFVLRGSWPAAEAAYDQMIEQASPHEERWMAWGYEKLGLIHEQQEKWKLAHDCARLAQILYGRLGSVEKAAEMELRLQKIGALPVTA